MAEESKFAGSNVPPVNEPAEEVRTFTVTEEVEVYDANKGGFVKIPRVKPDPHPLAQEAVQRYQAHRATRRKGSEGPCDLCGQGLKAHQKYFPDRNPVGDATTAAAGWREVDAAEISKYSRAMGRVPSAESDDALIEA